MTYSPQELEKYFEYSDNTEAGDKMFLDLHNRAKNQDLSYTESYYYCTILKHTYQDYGKPEDYLVCREHVFNDLFRTYYKDLYGYSILTDKWGNVITSEQKIKDLDELNNYFIEWESVIKNSQKEELMIQVARETRDEIRTLKKNPLFIITGLFYESNKFKYQYKNLILRSRFIRNFELEHNDKFGELIIINFNGMAVEFNAFSLTHIYFRHYSKLIKQTDLDKSFHKEIDYSKLGIEIKNILEKISNSGKLGAINRQIIFKYKSKLYSIWISGEKEKSIKGMTGNQKYYQIETFYPIEKDSEVQKLKGLSSYMIEDDLFLLQ